MSPSNNPSIISTIADMQNRGFCVDFCIAGNEVLCVQQKRFLQPEEFDVIEMYRFPSDEETWQETVIYGIEGKQEIMKGILLSCFAANNPQPLPCLIKKITRFWGQVAHVGR